MLPLSSRGDSKRSRVDTSNFSEREELSIEYKGIKTETRKQQGVCDCVKAYHTMNWEIIAQRKREQRDALIPDDWKLSSNSGPCDESPGLNSVIRSSDILTSEEIRITESSVDDLISRLHARGVKAVDVTRAFCKRAAIACQLVSAGMLWGLGSGSPG